MQIEKAIEQFGGQVAFADAVGVSQSAVHKWLYGADVSPGNALKIQQVTDGRIRATDLRPDLMGLLPCDNQEVA